MYYYTWKLNILLNNVIGYGVTGDATPSHKQLKDDYVKVTTTISIIRFLH